MWQGPAWAGWSTDRRIPIGKNNYRKRKKISLLKPEKLKEMVSRFISKAESFSISSFSGVGLF